MSGFEGTGRSCNDIDECAVDGFCGDNSVCQNSIGDVSCTCENGFFMEVDVCVDIDECATPEDTFCNTNAICINNDGNYDCECNNGYEGDGFTCEDINECNTDVGQVCDAGLLLQCVNTEGAFTCACAVGAVHNAATNECEDIDECQQGIAGCQQSCVNLPGSFECGCMDGYLLNVDGSCTNIDECVDAELNDCDQNAVCADTDGSFTCACNDGFTGTGHVGDCIEDTQPEVDECAEGTHNCDFATTDCQDTVDGFNCVCKERYIPTAADNVCEWDRDSCDSKADLAISWRNINKCKIFAKDDKDTVTLRCNVPGIPGGETTAYTGFNIFTKKYCGTDFITGLTDGRVQYDYLDNKEQYITENSYYRDDTNTPSRSSVTLQYNSPANSETANIGNKKKDMMYLILRGLSNVDFGSKTLDDCIAKAAVGWSTVVKTQDETGCVGWVKNVTW